MLVSNKSKAIKIIVGVILLIHIFSLKVFAMVKPTYDFYVNDYAGLLNSDTENYIININQALYPKTGAQIVVVTVPNLEGNSLEEYATKLFRNFGIGDKTKNNGVLLLLALEERQFRVEVGYGLEGCLNDAKTGRIQDEYIIPYLKENNWDQGIRNGFNAILQEVSDEYGVSIESAGVANRRANSEDLISNKYFQVFCIIIAISFILGALTRWVSIKFGIVYIIYFIGAMLIIKFIWSDCLQNFSMISITGYIIALVGGSGSSGGYSGGGRRFFWWGRFLWRRTEALEVFSFIESLKSKIRPVLHKIRQK